MTRALRAKGRKEGMKIIVVKAILRARGESIRLVDVTRLVEWRSIHYCDTRLRENNALGQGANETYLKRLWVNGKFVSKPIYSAPKTMIYT